MISFSLRRIVSNRVGVEGRDHHKTPVNVKPVLLAKSSLMCKEIE